MSGVASASALRRLYERYRTASAARLVLSTRKPGEWLVVAEDSADARMLSEAIGADSANRKAADPALKALAAMRLNEVIGADDARHDVRACWFRNGTSKAVHVRFALVRSGKKHGGRGALDRAHLPPAIGAQLSLDSMNEDSGSDFNSASVEPENATSRHDGSDGRRVDKNFHGLSGVPVSQEVSQDLAFLAHLLDPADFEVHYANASAGDDSEIGRMLAEIAEEIQASENEIDPDQLIENMRRTMELAQHPAPVVDLEAPEPQNWHTTSRQVVSSTLDLVRSYRGRLGSLGILAPSPGTGKTHGMAEAAREEQGVGRRVAYAVLSREQIPEAVDRLKGPLVRLHVIEGRHEGNCASYAAVQVAASMGHSPGRTVCPGCDLYPDLQNPVRSLGRTCEYYASRIRAVRDRKIASVGRSIAALAPPIIVTTHASLAIGTQLSNRRLQEFWTFDTVFIDEDPTASMEQMVEIWDHQLTYSAIDPQSGQPDAHTHVTRLLHAAFSAAKAERAEAHRRGYQSPSDASVPDPLHHRDHGSSYASTPLIALLDRAAGSLGYDLQTVLAQVINESSTKVPQKGELIGLSAAAAARKFPHRWLAAMAQQLLNETNAREIAISQGLQEPDFAYKIHVDLVLEEGSDPATPGRTHGVIRLHQAIPFAARESNVVVGDAYADVTHYEFLFDRFRRKGQVDVINHRAAWPRSSKLVRLITAFSSADLATRDRFRAHLEQHVAPILSLEEGRSVLLYTHLSARGWLSEWLVERDFGLAGWAVEHWGSGRGKDVYREFDTFVATTEFVPNTGGLVHEANARVLAANPGAGRVRFWGWGADRTGPATFAQAISASHPALLSAFQRKATDELAQAVHRIRPAIPGRTKRAWILGHRVPLSAELLAATSATIAVDEGGSGLSYETETDERGMRLESTTGILGFISAREMATAIADVCHSVGCWSPIFCHVLLAASGCADLRQILSDQFLGGHGMSVDVAQRVILGADDTLIPDPSSPLDAAPPPQPSLAAFAPVSPGAAPLQPSLAAPVQPHAVPAPEGDASARGSAADLGLLRDRVLYPPPGWAAIEDRVRWTRVYRDAIRLFTSSLPPGFTRGSVIRPWMPARSHGVECIGNPLRLERIIDRYAPSGSVPF